MSLLGPSHDLRLARRAAAGEPAAWREIVDRFGPRIHSHRPALQPRPRAGAGPHPGDLPAPVPEPRQLPRRRSAAGVDAPALAQPLHRRLSPAAARAHLPLPSAGDDRHACATAATPPPWPSTASCSPQVEAALRRARSRDRPHPHAARSRRPLVSRARGPARPAVGHRQVAHPSRPPRAAASPRAAPGATRGARAVRPAPSSRWSRAEAARLSERGAPRSARRGSVCPRHGAGDVRPARSRSRCAIACSRSRATRPPRRSVIVPRLDRRRPGVELAPRFSAGADRRFLPGRRRGEPVPRKSLPGRRRDARRGARGSVARGQPPARGSEPARRCRGGGRRGRRRRTTARRAQRVAGDRRTRCRQRIGDAERDTPDPSPRARSSSRRYAGRSRGAP